MAAAKNGRTVLLGEDDLDVRSYLETALKCQGYSVEVAQDGDEVLACLQSHQGPISAVVLDMIMPGGDGIHALKEIRRFHPDLPVIMMSGIASPLNVAEAMKNGANDFIPKPIQPDDLRKALKLAFEARQPAASKPAEPAPDKRQVFFGTSPYMQQLQRLMSQIGRSETPVLIQGETGVGKEVFARELHARSPRAKKVILKLNCAALPSELVESELFGYERGAFTGAFQKKAGMFELADGGTILLDEIGDMDIKLQAKLLQVLQDQEFQRLGGKDTIRVDVRVIAATHRDLEKAIAENTFREDLYYRLNVINMRVPSLRERKEDILPLVEFLLRKHTAGGSAPLHLPPSLNDLFLAYRWPGNIRELENLIRKFVALRDPALIEEDLRAKIRRLSANAALPAVVDVRGPEWPPAGSVPAPVEVAIPVNMGAGAGTSIFEQVETAKQEAERTAILGALKSTKWNRRRAAVLLKIDYKALLYKMKKLSIKKEKPAIAPAGPESGTTSNARRASV